MDEARERRRLAIFEAVEGVPEPERSALIEKLCEGDAPLRAAVEELLAWEGASHPLDAPFATAAHLLAAAEDPLRPGALLGAYRIEAKIGVGGMGTVYRARRDDLGLLVAIKVLHAGALRRGQFARFQNEGKILARLQHPGIARVLDVGVHRERGPSLAMVLPYLVMEYVDGRTLLAYCQPLPLAQRLQVIARLCHAVQAGHRIGIVHGDLKPENVLVEAGGQPRIIDFGIASLVPDAATSITRLAEVTPALGTIPYCSPERLRGRDPIDTRADVYALGVLLYQVVTDRLPIPIPDEPTMRDVDRLCSETPPAPSSVRAGLPRDLDWIVLKALAADPVERYPSAAQIADDLDKLAEDLPVSATPPNRLRELRRALYRRRGLWLGTGAVVASLTIGLAGTAVYAQRARDEARRAEQALDVMRGTSELVVSRLNEALLRPGPGARQLREDLLSTLLSPLARTQLQAAAAWPTQHAVSAMVALTDLALAKGDVDLAATMSGEALATATRLKVAAPASDDTLAWLGAAHHAVASVAIRRSASPEALAASREAVAACELAANRGSTLGKQWLVRCRERLAGLLAGAGEWQPALVERRAAVDLQRLLFAAGACTRNDLGESLIGLVLALDQRGDAGGTELLEEILTLHADLQPSTPDAAAAGQVALAKQRLGNQYVNRGNLERGLAYVDEAVATRARLHSADPDDTRQVRAYVDSLRAQCYANRRATRYATSLAASELGVELARKLVLAAPDDTDSHATLVQVLADAGQGRRLAGRDGTPLLAEAISILRDLQAKDPQRKHITNGATLSRMMAEGLRAAGRLRAALGPAADAVEAWRGLAASSPEDLEVRSRMAAALWTLGRIQLESGDIDGARASFEVGTTELRELRRQQPQTASHRETLVSTWLQLGYVELEAGRADRAKEHLEAACAACRERLAAFPEDGQTMATLVEVLQTLAPCLQADDSVSALEEALELRRRPPAKGGDGTHVAQAFELVARSHLKAGRDELASAALQAAIEQLGDATGAATLRAKLASTLAGVPFLRTPTAATPPLAIADCLALAERNAESVPWYAQALGQTEFDDDPEVRLRAATNAARACRRTPALGDQALAWLGDVVRHWRERIADPTTHEAERAALVERLRSLRAEEFAFMPLRGRAEWFAIFPEAAT